MPRTDRAYWERLRKDGNSALAVLLTMAAVFPAVIGLIVLLVPGSQPQARANPLYWLAMLPAAWWAVLLANYQAGAVRTIRLAMALGPMICGINALWAYKAGQGVTAYAVALVGSLLAAAAGWWFFNRSMVRLEGPAR